MPKYYEYFALSQTPLESSELYTPTSRYFLFLKKNIGEPTVRAKTLTGNDLKHHFDSEPSLTLFKDEEQAYQSMLDSAEYNEAKLLTHIKPCYIIKTLQEIDFKNTSSISINKSQIKCNLDFAVISNSDNEPIAVYDKTSRAVSRTQLVQ